MFLNLTLSEVANEMNCFGEPSSSHLDWDGIF